MKDQDHSRGAAGSLETLCGMRVIDVIGHGAGSTIYKVRDSRDDHLYAVKRVKLDDTSSRRFIDQLETEYATSQVVLHGNLRVIFKLHKVRSLLKLREAQLVMEYVEGHHLGERRPHSLRALVRIFTKVAEVLHAMADRGYVHADMKPQNIMVTGDGGVKVIDLGQSCMSGTSKKRLQGTPDYIAPEQVRRRPLTAQTDMYNFGASLYWCLTDHAIPTMIAKVGEHGDRVRPREKFHPPSRYRPDLPKAMNLLIGDLLRTRPVNRPESWTEVIERLNVVDLQLRRDPSEIAKPKANQRRTHRASDRGNSDTGEITPVGL